MYMYIDIYLCLGTLLYILYILSNYICRYTYVTSLRRGDFRLPPPPSPAQNEPLKSSPRLGLN